MKKLTKILIISLILLLSSLCFSQTTTVTFQVTDTPDGQSWNNGTWDVQLLPPTNNISISSLKITTTGQPVPNSIQSGSLSAIGSGSVVVTPTTAITPMGTQWTFTVCPFASSPCYSQNYVIYGSTQSITINPPSIRIKNPNTILAKTYGDFEIIASPGMLWLDTVLNQLRYVNALDAIVAVSGGGSAGNPGGVSGQTQYNAGGSSFGGYTMSGDCTIVTTTGVITCTGSSGTSFGTAAFKNYTDYTVFPFQSLTLTGSNCAAPTLGSGVLNIPPCTGGGGSGTVQTSTQGYFGYYATSGTVISGDANIQETGTAIALIEPETITVSSSPTVLITAQISSNALPGPVSGYAYYEADSTGQLGENIDLSGTATGWFPYLTQNNVSTQLQNLSGCNTAGYAYMPQANNCAPANGGVPNPGANGIPTCTGTNCSTSAIMAIGTQLNYNSTTQTLGVEPNNVLTLGASNIIPSAAFVAGCTTYQNTGSSGVAVTLPASFSISYQNGGCINIINQGNVAITVNPNGNGLGGALATSSQTISAGTATSPTGMMITWNGTFYNTTNWGNTNPWSSLLAPTTNLAITMPAGDTTAFTWVANASPAVPDFLFIGGADTGTSTTPTFSFTESGASASGVSGPLLNINTASGTHRIPLQVTAGGTTNGISMSTTGSLSAIGTGSIVATNGTVDIAAGTVTLDTVSSLISSGSCLAASGSTVTTTSGNIANVATTDTIIATPNADPTLVSGYAPSASGSLYVQDFPTSGGVSFRVCNNTSAGITPGSVLTMNWKVVR